MSAPRRPTLSVVLITLNEERMLERVLESVSWADEIVVVDSGSTDRTEEIARRFTSHFHVREYVGEGEQRRRTLEIAKGDWVLAIDGDEVVTPELQASILAALASPGSSAGFRMRLHTFFLGRWFGRRGWRREWKLRLFDRSRGRFDPTPVHSGVIVDGPVGSLDGALLHFPYASLEHMVAKLNRYSTVMSTRMAGSDTSMAPRATGFFRGTLRFLRDFILGGDFLYGRAGLIRSVSTGYFTFLKHAKTWEMTNRHTPDGPK